MALTTKLNLSNSKVYQGSGDTLNLSGSTIINGTLEYNGFKNFTNKYQIVDKNYVTGVTSVLGVQTANNGLTKSFLNVGLGGALTGNTTVGSGSCILGINVSSFDITAPVKICTTPATGLSSDGVLVWNSLDKCVKQINVTDVLSSGITGATNGLTKVGQFVKLGGALTGNTTIGSGSCVLGINTSSFDITAPIKVCTTPITGVNTDGVLVWNSVDKCIKQIGLNDVLSCAITGASNGLSKFGSHCVCLGGTLTSPVTVCGASTFKVGDTCGITLSTYSTTDIGLNAKSNGGIYLKSQTGVTDSVFDFTGAVGLGVDYDAAGGFAIYDNRIDTNRTGIVYANNYSNNYVNRSLVDKQYVDSVATGLNTHAAVAATTTSDMALSGLTIVDGVQTTTGMRILVKNQLTGWQNGIYSASTGTWGRTSDYDFTPVGEVVNGDIIPVISGTTEANSIWILTTPNPIVSGDSLSYSIFLQQLSLSEGNGISITNSGISKLIAVKLSPTACGLQFNGTGLEQDWNMYRVGLTCASGGKVDVRISKCAPSGSEIPVAINTGGTNVLYVDTTTVISCLGTPIINANNGLNKIGNNVRLGGALTGNTAITGSYTLSLTGGTQLNTTLGYQISGSTILRTSPNVISTILIGNGAGNNTSTGTNSIAIGCQTLYSNTNGHSNIALGYRALYSDTWGGCNIAIGNTALYGNTCGMSNVALGYQALAINTSGGENIAIGYGTLANNSTGSYNNAFGGCALQLNTTGSYNLANGVKALFNNTSGSNNIANGCETLCKNTTGSHNIANGYWALASNISGDNNITIGKQAGYSNVTGSTSIFLGQCAGYNETKSNRLYVSNSSTTQPLLYGEFDTKCAVIHGAFKTSGTTSLLVTPNAGTISDSVLVRNSGTGEIKIVNGASLGDKNNIYAKTTVTGSTILTTGSTYVILVNHSAPAIITLPATPIDGQVFRIKDAAYLALSNPITVGRNGKNIDRQPYDALINTDAGALELVYDSTLGWFSFSFVN